MTFCALVASVIVLVLVYPVAANADSDFWNEHITVDGENYLQDSGNEEARRKKKGGKYIIPLIVGALLIKSILFPLIVKAMAVMSTIAVFMSTLSLIVSSIVGYAKLAFHTRVPKVKFVHFADKNYDAWAKEDATVATSLYAEPLIQDSHLSEGHYYLAQ